MPRSVNHVASRAKRKKILGLTRGYFGARKNVWTVAKNTWEKGLTYAFRDRRNKKRNFRALWIQRINAAARLEGLSYSQLMLTSLSTTLRLSRPSLQRLSNTHHSDLQKKGGERQSQFPSFFRSLWADYYLLGSPLIDLHPLVGGDRFHNVLQEGTRPGEIPQVVQRSPNEPIAEKLLLVVD